MDVLIHAKTVVPMYSRINRLIRDIPSTYIEDGNKKTNLRQIVQIEMAKRNLVCRCIRCREIRNEKITDIDFDIYEYKTAVSTEKFLSFNSKGKLLGFLRLSIPDNKDHFIKELSDSTIIRELHVYGQALAIKDTTESAQHIGLGKKLLIKAEQISSENGFHKISVISGIGTREYYRKRGYKKNNLYQTKEI